LMPEALESWAVDLFGKLLPRHLQIIYDINSRFLKEISKKYPGDSDRLARMSIIEEGYPKKIRMGNLCAAMSFSVNGVSALHSKLITSSLFRDFYEHMPGKFNNKTNGITQRAWLLKANPGLSRLITEHIGDRWITDLDRLKKLIPFKEKRDFRERWRAVKHDNKKRLAEYIQKTTALTVDPDSLFDAQIKRMHEYKRQILFGFYIISQYIKIRNDPNAFLQPRTFIAAGKAAPGYFMAKLSIKFINSIADVINNDKLVSDRIKVVFLENYSVSIAEMIIPASELSEQISTAGTEASGTSNMKFMLNGALTMGTMDGATIEIAELVGSDNIFLFGLKADEITRLRNEGYHPRDFIQRSPVLREVIKLIESNHFSRRSPGIFDPIIRSISDSDPFFLCADFDPYLQAQESAGKAYQDRERWTERSIMNAANTGKFSSDRAIREYAEDIWKIKL
ncbi:MAG: glycogen/starch/alpha-glucan family phosphorylase, partial [Candidatus Omnitrophota bacterium]